METEKINKEQARNDALRASAKARIKAINNFVKEHSFNE